MGEGGEGGPQWAMTPTMPLRTTSPPLPVVRSAAGGRGVSAGGRGLGAATGAARGEGWGGGEGGTIVVMVSLFRG